MVSHHQLIEYYFLPHTDCSSSSIKRPLYFETLNFGCGKVNGVVLFWFSHSHCDGYKLCLTKGEWCDSRLAEIYWVIYHLLYIFNFCWNLEIKYDNNVQMRHLKLIYFKKMNPWLVFVHRLKNKMIFRFIFCIGYSYFVERNHFSHPKLTIWWWIGVKINSWLALNRFTFCYDPLKCIWLSRMRTCHRWSHLSMLLCTLMVNLMAHYS